MSCLAAIACGGSSAPESVGSNGEAASVAQTRSSDDLASCAVPFLESENENTRRITGYARDIANAAPGSYPLQAMISLDDPAFDFSGGDIAAREAQVAPYQEPIVTLVEQHGGTVVSRSWLINSLVVELPAGEVLAALCWPNVTSLEVSTAYWDAVAPPWDVDQVGTSECPIIDGDCPEHCERIEGRRFDDARQCTQGTGLLVACARHSGPHTADEKCRYDQATGELLWFGGAAPLEPAFDNFRDCTVEEHQRVILSPLCTG
jgi:hypothetical protein